MLATSDDELRGRRRKAVDDGKAAVAVIIPADFSAVVYGSDADGDERRSSCTRTRPARSAAPSSRAWSDRCSRTSTAPARPPPAPSPCVRSGDPRRPQRSPRAPPRRSATRAASRPACRSAQRSPQAGKTEQGRQRHRPHPRRHDDLLHVLRRRQRGADDPHRGPRRHPAAPVHDADAARHDHRRQVRRRVRDRARAGGRAARRRPPASSASTGAGSTPSSCSRWSAAGVAGGLALLVISFAKTPAQAGAIGAGVYLVLALLGGNFTGTAQTERDVRRRPEVHAQRLAAPGLGHDACAAAAPATSAGRCWCPLGFAVAFFFFAVLRMRRRFS